jgi:hypothetical protein
MVKNKKEMPQAEGVTLLHLHPLVKREENAIIKFFSFSLSILFTSGNVAKCGIPPTLLPRVFSQPISVCQSIESCLGCHWMRYTRRGHCVCVRYSKEQNPVVPALLFSPPLSTHKLAMWSFLAQLLADSFFFLPLESQTKTPEKSSPQPKKPLTFRYIHPIPGWI